MTLISQREIAKLRRSISPDDDPNHSFLRQRLSSQSASSFRTLGVRYTSPWTLAGWPLLDVQFGDPQLYGGAAGLHARGWIALGDRATGILFAVGGIARGLVACGGVAIGGLAIGGLSVGLLSLGGAALGGLAVGGLGIGYDSVGGLAIGWHSAAGGAAIAHDLAVGGGAAARHFAVGGAASANEANTPAARLAVESESYLWVVQWISDHHLVFIAATVLLSILPAFLLPFCYRRVPVQEADSSADEDDENED